MENLLALLIVAIAAACLWLLGRGWHAVAGTTLRAACAWAFLAVAAIATVEVVAAYRAGRVGMDIEELRFAAALVIFCPTTALLGAKRPQNTAWQFVVMALWSVLVLPVFELWMRGRGETFSLDPVRSGFILVLVALTLLNHVGTRFVWAACAVALAQSILVWPQLPWADSAGVRPPPLAGLLLVLAAAIECARAGGLPRFESLEESEHAAWNYELLRWHVVWRDFRDWFGVVWSLRVMERLNATADLNRWPVRLRWDGFVRQNASSIDGPSTTASISEIASHLAIESSASVATIQSFTAIDQAFHSLLWRFVSREWIEKRPLNSNRPVFETGRAHPSPPLV